jgi:hypothetical protein
MGAPPFGLPGVARSEPWPGRHSPVAPWFLPNESQAVTKHRVLSPWSGLERGGIASS